MTDFDPRIIAEIAEALDPRQSKGHDWWSFTYNGSGVDIEYVGPTDPAAAKAAFEVVVRRDFDLRTRLHASVKEQYAGTLDCWGLSVFILLDMTPEQYLTALHRAIKDSTHAD